MSRYSISFAMLWTFALSPFNSFSQSREFQKLLETNRLFELRDSFSEHGHKLSQSKQLYYKAAIDNAFGRHIESNAAIVAIDSLKIQGVKIGFNRSYSVNLLTWKSDNYAKLYDYQAAADAAKQILDLYSKSLSKIELDEVQNLLKTWSSMRSIPPTTVLHCNDATIPLTVNKFDHWLIPVSNHYDTASATEFVFDSGAGFSTIREGLVDDFGVILSGESIDVGNSVGGKIVAKTGHIPLLYIGDLVFENVIVLVLPDAMLEFETPEYKIDGIIGFPVIRLMGEFSISKNGPLRVSQEPICTMSQNLFTSGHTPFVQAKIANKSATLVCDTGALTSQFSMRFYKSNRKLVKNLSQKSRVKLGGVGEMITVNGRNIKDFSIQVSGRDFVIHNAVVMKSQTFQGLENDGFLGQDVLLQPSEVVMNLRDMYLYFKD